MFNALPQNPAKVLTMVALLAAMLFGAGYASAGTQWPPWRVRQLKAAQAAQAQAQLPSPPPITQSTPEVVDEVDPPANDDNGQPGGEGSVWEGLGNGGGDQGVAPVSAPSPSALLAGLGMIGLLAGRRQRKSDD